MQMIQWFGCYEEVCIYRKGWEVQNFGQKQHSESIHCVNRFRQLNDTQDDYED